MNKKGEKYLKLFKGEKMIERNKYLQKLIDKKNNGMVKIITGIRRCGKSTLLFNIYYDYLLSTGIKKENIITIQLDRGSDYKYRDPIYLCDYVKEKISSNENFYIFIDEIQFIENIKIGNISSSFGLYEVLNELNSYKNLDVYVTGSNSKMLSTDIATEFRGRGDQIKLSPLTYKEFYDAYVGDKKDALNEYSLYGGMPKILSLKTHEDKSNYLIDLFQNVYIKDVLERYNIKNDKNILDETLKLLSSSIGSLTNTTKLSNTFSSVKKIKISHVTLSRYIDYFLDAFLLSKVFRYDVKGKFYINTPLKYYFSDIGLRNALLNFRNPEPTHIMENIIYNELINRGYSVDIGVIEYTFFDQNNKKQKTQLEIDFICNKGNLRYYIQSAYAIYDSNKQEQETRGFNLINDSFKKIVILRDCYVPYYDEKGIFYLGIEDFLLNENSLEGIINK